MVFFGNGDNISGVISVYSTPDQYPPPLHSNDFHLTCINACISCYVHIFDLVMLLKLMLFWYYFTITEIWYPVLHLYLYPYIYIHVFSHALEMWFWYYFTVLINHCLSIQPRFQYLLKLGSASKQQLTISY